jgi:hypothetical protein
MKLSNITKTVFTALAFLESPAQGFTTPTIRSHDKQKLNEYDTQRASFTLDSFIKNNKEGFYKQDIPNQLATEKSLQIGISGLTELITSNPSDWLKKPLDEKMFFYSEYLNLALEHGTRCKIV